VAPAPPPTTPFVYRATLQPPTLPPPTGIPGGWATVLPTTSIWRVRPPTTTTRPTTTIFHLQTLPPVFAPQLGPRWCPALSDAERLQAAYTQWELHWSLSRQVVLEIDKQLNRVFSQIPPMYFAQRPTTAERVRLVWEVLVARCGPGEWLHEHGPCPSAPGSALFGWFHRDEQAVLKRLALQFLEPPHMVPPSFSDCGLKVAWESWEEEMRLYGRVVSRRQRTTPPPLSLTPHPSPPDEPPADAPAPSLLAGPFLSFAQCHQAGYSPAGNPYGNLWQSGHDPCSLASSCDKLWVVRAGLLAAMVLGLAHTIPASLSFCGSEQRSVLRLAPSLGVYLSSGTFFLLAVAEVSALTVSTPQGLNGAGFGCTTAAVVLSFFGACLSKVGSEIAKAESPHAVKPVRAVQVADSSSMTQRVRKSPAPVLKYNPRMSVSSVGASTAVSAWEG